MMTAEEIPVREILDFWFGAPSSPEYGENRAIWFARDDAFDAAIRDHFGAAVDRVVAGTPVNQATTPDEALSLVIFLDQFPRNLYRGSARAFAADGRALATAEDAIAKGFDQQIPPFQRVFVYMPFMHSERLVDQDRCIALCRANGLAENLHFARAHRDIIVRFGRFPHRNAALGRASTAEEEDFLRQPGSSF